MVFPLPRKASDPTPPSREILQSIHPSLWCNQTQLWRITDTADLQWAAATAIPLWKAEKARRYSTATLSGLSVALRAIAENPNSSPETLHSIAQEIQGCSLVENRLVRNPSTTPETLLLLGGSEWEDVRREAGVRLREKHLVFLTHHIEEWERKTKFGEIMERRREGYTKSLRRPVWQPKVYTEMYSDRENYPENQ